MLKHGLHGLGHGLHRLGGWRLLLGGRVLDSIFARYKRGSLTDKGEATTGVLYVRGFIGPDEDGGRSGR